jgi:hypothetical protein
MVVVVVVVVVVFKLGVEPLSTPAGEQPRIKRCHIGTGQSNT